MTLAALPPAVPWRRLASLLISMSVACSDRSAARGGPGEGGILAAEGRRTSAIVGELAAAARPRIALRWLDTGITVVGERDLSGGHFTLFGKPAMETPSFASSVGVVDGSWDVVRMPERRNERTHMDRHLTREEWELEGAAMEQRLYDEIRQRAAEGVAEFEIRTVQVINPTGYLDPRQQAQIEQFARTFLAALYRVRKRLEAEGAVVTASAACGSNGCYAASRAIPWLADRGMNPIEAILMYDGRAFEHDVERLIELLGEKVAIINTSGDVAGSARDFWRLVAALLRDPLLAVAAEAYPRLIASYDCSRRLKSKYPGIRVIFAAPDNFLGIGVWFTRHIAMMKAGSISLVKEWMGEGRPPRRLGRLSGAELAADLNQSLGYPILAATGAGGSSGRTTSPRRADRHGSRRYGELTDEEDSGCGSQDDPCFDSADLIPFPPPCPPWSFWCWVLLGGGRPPCDPTEERCAEALADGVAGCDPEEGGCGDGDAAGFESAGGWSLFPPPGDRPGRIPTEISDPRRSFNGEGGWGLPAEPEVGPDLEAGRVFVLFESAREYGRTERDWMEPPLAPLGGGSYVLFSTTGPGKRGGRGTGRNRSPAWSPPPRQRPPGRQPKPGPRPRDQRFSIWSSSNAVPESNVWPDFLRYGVLPIFEPFPDLEGGRWSMTDILITR